MHAYFKIILVVLTVRVFEDLLTKLKLLTYINNQHNLNQQNNLIFETGSV